MILDEIVDTKRDELSKRPVNAFKTLFDQQGCKLICELKQKSPNHPDSFFSSAERVIDDYKAAGVDALSVVTDETYFGGSEELLREARASQLPTLRKDFIIDARQIVEMSTDALLLIARIVSTEALEKIVTMCLELGVEPVVEIHDETDLSKAIDSGANTIAVNSRDLQTQDINQENALSLLGRLPSHCTKLFFSGVTDPEDIRIAKKAGAQGILVGTAALIGEDRVEFVSSLRRACDE